MVSGLVIHSSSPRIPQIVRLIGEMTCVWKYVDKRICSKAGLMLKIKIDWKDELYYEWYGTTYLYVPACTFKFRKWWKSNVNSFVNYLLYQFLFFGSSSYPSKTWIGSWYGNAWGVRNAKDAETHIKQGCGGFQKGVEGIQAPGFDQGKDRFERGWDRFEGNIFSSISS